ncbi:UDP:flavonoid glycosyltransferase YjiC (YdhE family) [Crossiella equi]|uniref:UDP:flavonoid glycosyltransferase YjiC (YdhE family) n=1 Tax=Crossiella equi TaxID=130796 RepID=A0ABS5AD50_9PSEU|nr:nucleotide disphospho-sugar-binding domain-containing protein [Crossiella equi]MBP2474498.1 UDP:flavonoid glycosyltransferase YjiC (YdhE family) [Crossiella equi]
MRVFFTSSMGLGHLFPMISTMWALRAAGHEVRVATAGTAAEAAANAGLHVVDATPGVDWEQEIQKLVAEHFGNRPPGSRQGQNQEQELGVAGQMFAGIADRMADVALREAEAWGADLVVYELTDATGPMIAAKLGIPCVQHGFGLTAGDELFTAMMPHLAPAFERLGIDGLAPRAQALDVAPSSLEGELGGLPTRYVPFNGGGVLPQWLLEPTGKPRLVITMGTAVGQFAGVDPWRAILAATKKADAELVLATNAQDLSELGELPENVRVVDYLPLSALLPVSTAIIHHGGSGSTLTAADAGVTQLIVPQGADQFFNAERVAKRGCGLSAVGEGVTEEQVYRLVHDEALRTAAREVQAEMRAMPSPAARVPELEALVG